MIDQSRILLFENRSGRSLNEERRYRHVPSNKTAFLCHSHLDAQLAKSIQGFLHDSGWNVYIDWEDQRMPQTPNRQTAQTIKNTIGETAWFLYLATRNSSNSKWCPWEIGYADGVKHIDKILVIPTKDKSGSYGQEYLELYRRIDFYRDGRLAAFEPNGEGVYTSSLS